MGLHISNCSLCWIKPETPYFWSMLPLSFALNAPNRSPILYLSCVYFCAHWVVGVRVSQFICTVISALYVFLLFMEWEHLRFTGRTSSSLFFSHINLISLIWFEIKSNQISTEFVLIFQILLVISDPWYGVFCVEVGVYRTQKPSFSISRSACRIN